MIIVCQVEAVIHFEDDTEEMQQWDQQVPLFEVILGSIFHVLRHQLTNKLNLQKNKLNLQKYFAVYCKFSRHIFNKMDRGNGIFPFCQDCGFGTNLKYLYNNFIITSKTFFCMSDPSNRN